VFVAWMVVGYLVFLEVCVGGYPIHFLHKGAVPISVYVDVNKWQLTCFLSFHGFCFCCEFH